MKNCTSILLAIALLSAAGGGVAEEGTKHVMAVEVAGHGATDGVAFKLDSEDLGFELDDMQVGETRSVVDEDGRPILITRNETGYSFNIDGNVIDLPNLGEADGEDMHWVTDGDDADVNVHVIRKNMSATISETGGTVIISPKPIDEATRLSIQSILESAGHGSDVEFIDHDGSDDGQVFIRQIEKVVDTS